MIENSWRITPANSLYATEALALVSDLQEFFVKKLTQVFRPSPGQLFFSPKEWFRDQGVHGGGVRFSSNSELFFNAASINVSQVHYDDDPQRKLGSATAISAIIHPFSPLLPSIHMHISWTELKDTSGYWRIMADLNPAISNPTQQVAFANRLQESSGDLHDQARVQGERYFFIPALKRHRGVVHFYLEGYNSGEFTRDQRFAKNFGISVIEAYGDLVRDGLPTLPMPTSQDFDQQLAYHTLYLFQVLTLDRGTTSGLLVHSDNDLGILGSLPARVDRDLLASWQAKVPPPMDVLVKMIVSKLPEESPCVVDDQVKKNLASELRVFYQRHPAAIDLLARGDLLPPTRENHK